MALDTQTDLQLAHRVFYLGYFLFLFLAVDFFNYSIIRI